MDDSAPVPPFSSSRFWVGTFTNDQPGATSVRATAVCGTLAGREVRKKTVKDAPAATEVSLRIRCPRGSRVTGGGVRGSRATTLQSRVSTPFDSGDEGTKPDDGWRVVAYPAAVADVGVVALCARGVPLAYRSATIGPFPDDTGATAQPGCNEGEALTGGGARSGARAPAT